MASTKSGTLYRVNKIEVQRARFPRRARNSVMVQINQQLRLDFVCKSAKCRRPSKSLLAAPLLNTETATLGEVVAT